jgi:hypothetical protein
MALGLATPLPAGPPARSLAAADERRVVAARAHGRAPAAAQEEPAIDPTDPHLDWTAEISWRSGSTSSVFLVVARHAGGAPVTLAESEPVEWPPGGPDAIKAMSEAAELLGARLRAAGWRPLPPGSAWYAKRFAWDAPARPAAAPSPPPLELQRQWPEDVQQRWRCEIEWSAGYARSRFRAVVHPPGKRRGQVIGASAAFRWTMREPPDPRSPAQVAEVRRLTTALQAAGWEPVGRGASWYSARCVWRGDGLPPEQLELPPAEEPS